MLPTIRTSAIAGGRQAVRRRTLDIGLSLLNAVVTLCSFVVILWGLSAAAPLHLFGKEYAIPGYLVWAALIYAVLNRADAVDRLAVGAALISSSSNSSRFPLQLVRTRRTPNRSR